MCVCVCVCPVTHPHALQVEFFHSKNIRVILWATSMIDTDSSNYQEARDKEYMIKCVHIISLNWYTHTLTPSHPHTSTVQGCARSAGSVLLVAW